MNVIGRGSDGNTTISTRTSLDQHLMLLMFLWLVAAIATVRSPSFADTGRPPANPLTSVDPNVVPWWELTVLPRIGEITARAIVQYRDSVAQSTLGGEAGPVFRRPADLAGVRGIGPKTVQRIAPYLRFDGRPGSDRLHYRELQTGGRPSLNND